MQVGFGLVEQSRQSSRAPQAHPDLAGKVCLSNAALCIRAMSCHVAGQVGEHYIVLPVALLEGCTMYWPVTDPRAKAKVIPPEGTGTHAQLSRLPSMR